MPRPVDPEGNTPPGTRVQYANMSEPGYYQYLLGRVGVIEHWNLDLYYVVFSGDDHERILADGEGDGEGRICFYPNELIIAEPCEGVLEARRRKQEEHAGT